MYERVCAVDELADGQTREFELAGRGAIFVVREGEQVFVYENRCPHTGVSLNWLPDRFLDAEGRYIQCDMHGALFRVEDGTCVFGPCAGDGLTPVGFRIEAGQLVIGPAEE